jgi:hypothetical protein
MVQKPWYVKNPGNPLRTSKRPTSFRLPLGFFQLRNLSPTLVIPMALLVVVVLHRCAYNRTRSRGGSWAAAPNSVAGKGSDDGGVPPYNLDFCRGPCISYRHDLFEWRRTMGDSQRRHSPVCRWAREGEPNPRTNARNRKSPALCRGSLSCAWCSLS